ncbi:hypothetical protein [Dyella telluris]|uniref:Uncharacterized protein n=1 Tax=Dyella telluris TaxID=2763498 RepID=A0A7G8PZ27_9GAMM|nr:hypothetical protein [Dyella telluris]QNJ99784.1 hypothetical protein H8F01_11545 [Dyella telluris]
MSVQFIICPHCAIELRKGIKVCRSCDATVSYGVPWPYTMTALLPSIWLAIASHHFFYDSLLVSMLIGSTLFGGLWAMLSMAFDDRVVFRRATR